MTIYSRLIWILFLLSANVASFANVALPNDFEKNIIPLSSLANNAAKPKVWYFEDKAKNTTLEKAQLLFKSGEFKKTDANFNFGFENAPYWVFLPVSIQGDESKSIWKEILLEFNYPHPDNIEIFRAVGNNPPEHFVTLGDREKFSDRLILDSVFVIPDALKVNENYRYWIRVETTSSMMLLISIWDKNNYIEEKNHRLLAFGIYYGILMVMVLYNIFIGFSIKDRSYLYYVGYIASFTLFQACLFGHAYQYLWPNLPGFNDFILPSSVLLSLFFALSFSRLFLQTGNHSQFFNRLLWFFTICSISAFFISIFSGYRVSILMSIVVGIGATLSIFSASINSIMSGFRGAKLFLIAWVTLLFAAIIMGLTGAGILPSNLFTRHVAQVGSAMEVILLSLALAGRINRMKAEKRAMEKQSKLELEAKNRELKQALKLLTLYY